MKKILYIFIACLCLVSCDNTKIKYKVYKGRVIAYQHHTFSSNDVLIKLDNGCLYKITDEPDCFVEGYNEYDDNGIIFKHYKEDNSHIKLVFSDSYGYIKLESISEIK